MRGNVKLLCAAIVGAAILMPSAALAKDTYYISSGMGAGAVQPGNDANAGTEALPFKTLPKAVSMLKAGDTLILRGGEYDTVNGLSANGGESLIPSGTSWENATTLKAYAGEKPVIRRYMPVGAKVDETTYRDSWHMPTYEECAAPGWAKNYPHSCWNGGAGDGLQEQSAYRDQGPQGYVLQMSNDASNLLQYIVVDGIDIDARGIVNTMTFAAGARHIRFQNLEIRYSIRSAISQPGIKDPSLETDLQFIRVKIHSCGVPYDTNKINGVLARKHPEARFRHPWYMHSGGNSLIDSEAYNCAGTGLSPDGNNNIIVGNFIHDNSVHGMYVSGGENWLICNNVLYNNGGAEMNVRDGGNHLIANNTIVAGPADNPRRATYGILLSAASRGSIIENNIICGIQQGIVNSSAQAQPHIIRNNLVFCPARPGLEFTDKGAKTPARMTNNFFGQDPKFVNAAAPDFRLQAGSPAIDAGYENGLTTDRLGVARPQGKGIDIGAYEFVGK